MNILDVRTVLFSYVISNAICAIGMGSLWLQRHRRSAELGYWLLDFLMQFLAVLLIALRGRVSDFLSIVVGSTLVIGGTLILYIGLERYANQTSPQLHNYFLLALFFFVHVYFTYVQPSLLARNLNLSVGLLVICSQCAWLMLHRVDVEMRQATQAVGAIFAAYSLVSLARVFVDLAVAPGNDLFKSGLYDTLVILSYQMLFIALTFALLLMRNRRLMAALEGDIRERKETELRLRYLGTHDAQTGLYNRGYFEEELARLERGRQFPVSIVMADVDDLKETNDREGHAAGDDLLKRVAQVLTAAFRTEDLVARIGGDEFAVLLPNTQSTVAEIALGRVRDALQENNVAHAGTPIRLSFGMSTAENQEALTAVIKEADDNMYREKREHEALMRDHGHSGT